MSLLATKSLERIMSESESGEEQGRPPLKVHEEIF